MGIYILPRDRDVKVWADADFRGNWFPGEAKDDSDMARSRLVFLYHIWDVQLCDSRNFIQGYPSSLIIVSKFHSVKHCA